MNRKPRVLFTTPILGHPPKGGPELRIENSIKALSRCSELYIHCRSLSRAPAEAPALDFYRGISAGFFQYRFFQQSLPYKVVKVAVNGLSRLFGRGGRLRYRESEAAFRAVVEKAAEVEAEVIWLGFGNISYPLLKYLKEHCALPVVVDTDSVWSRFVLRGAPYAGNEALRAEIEAEGKAKEAEERWGTRIADLTTAVSEIDAQYYRSLADRPEQVAIFSNVIDLACYRRPPAPAGFVTPSLFLAGTFGKNSPMEDAARWMIDLVLPLLKREIPGIHLYIAGINSRLVLDDDDGPNVTVLGEVDSVLPHLSNATVSVVPLRFESGTRFKILEAGACGVPVVSTTLGAEGIPVADGVDILIADTPENFARCLIRVVQDERLAARLALNLRQLVADRFSVEALEQEGRAILESLPLR